MKRPHYPLALLVPASHRRVIHAASLTLLLLASLFTSLPGASPKTRVDFAASRVDALVNDAAKAGFSGVVLMAGSSHVLLEKSVGMADRDKSIPVEASMPWRWASVSKQVTAVIVAQLVAEGRLSLDKPVNAYLTAEEFPAKQAGAITIRQLLRHTAGQSKPVHADGSTAGEALPPFYRAKVAPGSVHASATRTICAGPARHPAGEKFEYNNCDYLVLGAVIEKVTGRTFAEVLAARITGPLKLRSVVLAGEQQPEAAIVKGYADASRAETPFNLPTFGASGALVGTPRDLLALDQALMGESLMTAEMKKQFWVGDPAIGYMGMGVWAFPAALKGCREPVELVERRGSIGGVQVRNVIAPKLLKALVIFTNRGDWDFGDIRQGKGFAYELLSAGFCP
ncbi:MAG: serine hydrolase domain-containing protein [Betaproteobacteria bacterium]